MHIWLFVSCPTRTKNFERYLTHTVHTTLATLGQVPITSQMQPLKFTSCSWCNSSLTFIFMHHFYILKAGLKLNSQILLSKLIHCCKTMYVTKDMTSMFQTFDVSQYEISQLVKVFLDKIQPKPNFQMVLCIKIYPDV